MLALNAHAADGRIRELPLSKFPSRHEWGSATPSKPAIPGSIVKLHLTQNARTKEKFVVGGADDGSILFWNLDTLELCAKWIAFSTPLEKVVEFAQDGAGALKGCVICIARDGTIAVVVVDGFQLCVFILKAAAKDTTLTER